MIAKRRDAVEAVGRGWRVTEEEWLTSTNITQMWFALENLGTIRSNRKPRLFGCSCCRDVWHIFRETRSQELISIAECHADGLVSDSELADAHRKANELAVRSFPWSSCVDGGEEAAIRAGTPTRQFSADRVALACRSAFTRTAFEFFGSITEGSQSRLLRDIFGNPFRSVAFDPRWRTSDVVGVARAIYDDKAFERIPILADALMDAGCEDEQVISHCRGEGPHVRGCWVLDLILEKE